MKKYDEKLTKTEVANLLGISRPTLDKYLKNGFPKMLPSQANNISQLGIENDLDYQMVLLENEKKLCECRIELINKHIEEIKNINNNKVSEEIKK